MLEKLKETGYFFVLKANRDYPADTKRLVKCGVGKLFLQIKHILTANGVVVDAIVEDCSSKGYYITINNKQYVIYSAEELNSPGREYWELTIQRTFSIINSFLREAGSEERFFSTLGGSEEWAVFLTPALFDLLAKYGFVKPGKELFLYEGMHNYK